MAQFTFGQVEGLLAAINEIASDKRVAFGARLKHLQRQGIKGAGSQPGRGKAAKLNFGELMQMALAVELLKAGLPPQRAAQLVNRNWSSIRYSVYLATYTEYEALELAEQKGIDAPSTNWLWLIRADALAELTVSGASEYDDYEAIESVELEGLSSLLDALGSLNNPAGRRTLLINGTALTRAVLNQAAFHFRLTTIESMRESVLQEVLEESKRIEEAGRLFAGPPFTGDERAEILQKMKNRRQTDLTAPPTPPHLVEAHARELLKHLGSSAIRVLAQMNQEWGPTGTQTVVTEENREGIVQLLEFGAVIFAKDPVQAAEEGEPIAWELTAVGAAAVKMASLNTPEETPPHVARQQALEALKRVSPEAIKVLRSLIEHNEDTPVDPDANLAAALPDLVEFGLIARGGEGSGAVFITAIGQAAVEISSQSEGAAHVGQEA